MASQFKALSDPVRLRLLSIILDGGEVCVCDLTEPVGRSQPTVSHHVAVLAEAGLLTREERGKWTWYRANPDRIGSLGAFLQSPLIKQGEISVDTQRSGKMAAIG